MGGSPNQSERHAKRLVLGLGKALHKLEERGAQLLKRRKRQLHLPLNPDGTSHAKLPSRLDRPLEQRRLADPRLSMQHQGAAATIARSLQKPVEQLTLAIPPEQLPS